MARWCSPDPPPFTGTRDGVTVYQLQGDAYYVRMKSSITGKRIKSDPKFKPFRESSGRMAQASKIASFIYGKLAVKKYPLYREITGKAILLLKKGMLAAAVMERLVEEYLPKVKRLPVKRKLRLIVHYKPYRSTSSVSYIKPLLPVISS
jgi:hypothetical protein